MKTTGIIRKIDELGRIVVPKEIRKHFEIEEGDPLEIEAVEDKIIIQKHITGCMICGSTEGIVDFHEKKLCGKCIMEIKREF